VPPGAAAAAPAFQEWQFLCPEAGVTGEGADGDVIMCDVMTPPPPFRWLVAGNWRWWRVARMAQKPIHTSHRLRARPHAHALAMRYAVRRAKKSWCWQCWGAGCFSKLQTRNGSHLGAKPALPPGSWVLGLWPLIGCWLCHCNGLIFDIDCAQRNAYSMPCRANRFI
jgi:hypothetical protein